MPTGRFYGHLALEFSKKMPANMKVFGSPFFEKVTANMKNKREGTESLPYEYKLIT